MQLSQGCFMLLSIVTCISVRVKLTTNIKKERYIYIYLAAKTTHPNETDLSGTQALLCVEAPQPDLPVVELCLLLRDLTALLLLHGVHLLNHSFYIGIKILLFFTVTVRVI